MLVRSVSRRIPEKWKYAANTSKYVYHYYITTQVLTYLPSGFGGLEVACWPLVHKFAGSKPAEAVGFFRAKKNPQHAFLREGSKAVCPMS